MEENIVKYGRSEQKNSEMYFLVYINRLTDEELNRIAEGLKKHEWFYGYVPVSYDSRFKSYLSYILENVCVKCGDTVIGSHPEDMSDGYNGN